MDIRDFEGVWKYKLVVPIVYTVSWVLLFVGPMFLSTPYKFFSIFVMVYTIMKTVTIVSGSVVIFVRALRVLRRAESMQKNTYVRVQEAAQDVVHVLIIPIYKEPSDIINATLSRLASHAKAKDQYYVLLAMEAHEPNSDLLAKDYMRLFASHFKFMSFTRHQLRPNEQKGKASNVSWCGEHLAEILDAESVPEDFVFLTIIDSDSWVPEIYFEEIETYLQNHWDDRYKVMFQPPQIYTINNMSVPILTRVTDLAMSCLQYSNLVSAFDITFPLSNYTLSYNLIKRVGFWDTCADAIGEDFHTMQKCLWKTGGDMRSVPIYAPFNQVNIQTGKGYFSDVCARFWQAERHGQGVADVAYNISQFVRQPFNWRTFYALFFVLESFVLPPLFSTTFGALNIEYNLLTDTSSTFFSAHFVNSIFKICAVLIVLPYPLYEIIKRKANRILYQKQNESIFRMLEYLLLYHVSLLFILIPSLTIASFRVLLNEREYVKADKILAK